MFSFIEYSEFLRKAKSICTVNSFPGILEQSPETAHAIILRHDVDFSVGAAHELAQLELREGIRSSFLFMTSSDFYNVASLENRSIVRKLADQGFDIGLHLDPMLYESDPESGVRLEQGIIEGITGRPLRTISLHNPSVHGRFPEFTGFLNAYQPRFMTQGKYLSDSRMDFRGKDPLAFLAAHESGIAQVLLHPEHYSTRRRSYDEIFTEMFNKDLNRLHAMMLSNTTYRSDFADKNGYIVSVDRALP